jgi:probable rRNA maturation factor
VIYVRNATRTHRLPKRTWRRRARTLLDAAGVPGAGLSLSFVGDRAIRTLNARHRGKDKPTDVLSFPLFEPFAVPRGNGATAPEVLLGDVVISVDTAVRQARAYGARLDEEIERLLIHGILHLIGHDHEEPAERRRMVREERRLAAAIGLDWPYDGAQ